MFSVHTIKLYHETINKGKPNILVKVIIKARLHNFLATAEVTYCIWYTCCQIHLRLSNAKLKKLLNYTAYPRYINMKCVAWRYLGNIKVNTCDPCNL